MTFTHPSAIESRAALAKKRKALVTRRTSEEVQRQLQLHAVAGEPGEPGPRGLRGRDGATGEAGPRGPKGDKGEKGDRGERGAAGRDGEDGTKIFTGPKAPKGAKPGDLWLKPDGAYYELKNDKWRSVTEPAIRGPRGPAGAPGVGVRGLPGRDANRFDFGFGTPSGGRGGDVWLDLETGDFWKKQRDGWVQYFNVGSRAYAGNGAPTENPHDADDILEGDEPSSELESESELSSSDFDSESESESEFVSEFG
ncbi:hypothetical protein AB8A31_15825 [Tardiphaga sp. 804_B3_N1_9]|uniref:hypothetical protein n=1 Tax=Tardiphaga sp. 804_B3_N1_9 TaxID=3240786 RepID=UPI003F29DC7B